MDVRELLGIYPLPKDVEMLYRGIIKKRKRLKNGWDVIILKNNMAHLSKDNCPPMLVGGVVRIFEADDGKFMLSKEKSLSAVFKADGAMLSSFSRDTKLFKNGWYKVREKDGIALYNAHGECVGNRLTAAGVFKNGCYFMAVHKSADGMHAGVFDPNGKRLSFSNAKSVKMLWNGWFITEGQLFDNLGNAYIGTANGHTLDSWFLTCVGMVMPRKNGSL